MPIILFFVPYALALQQSMGASLGSGDLYYVSLGMTGRPAAVSTAFVRAARS